MRLDPQKYGRTIEMIVNNFIDDRIFASKAFIIHKTHIHIKTMVLLSDK